ncbi:LPS export ABC transporter permease LptG [Legionella nagasakiensis]|uniref:LPS export ABC transporter permease LptG n=1 Tax=Legionella nagasakiensis TaxID=535290 RepID=UPI0010566A98|nr:LPS export ABC transporter permease LptG [Legionella nagasakiensis]
MKLKLLDRYIAKTVLSAIFLVTLMLAGLQLFILFVNQLDDLGKAHYDIIQAAFFVLLQMPYQVYLFFPMASLLGSLIGLGIMANHRELVVMRAAGMSIGQVTAAVLKASLVIIVIVTITGETIIPRLASLANDKKLQAMSDGQALRTAKGMWLRNQNDFITIGEVLPNFVLRQVYQFHFDETHHLRLARKIEQLNFNHGTWYASGVSESMIEGRQIQTKQHDKMLWDVSLRPNILRVGSNEPDEMTLWELRQYLRIQKMNHQTALNYQLAYWQRLLQPLTTMVMMVLAIPFIFGPLRSSTMGSKLLAGATAGFGFHMINRIFGPVSQVFQWPVEIAAFGPTFLFMMLGLYLMRRVK